MPGSLFHPASHLRREGRLNSIAGAAEAVVVALASGGDQAAFDELVRRKQSSVRGLLRRLSNDAALAEDLAQVVFVEMWKSLSRLNSPAAFSGWLRKIAVNTWLQHVRKKGDVADRRLESIDAVVEEPATETISQGHVMDLAAALAMLPAPVRLCIVLAYHEGMSHGEIEKATGMPLGTIKSHILRGGARLKELLKDYGPGS